MGMAKKQVRRVLQETSRAIFRALTADFVRVTVRSTAWNSPASWKNAFPSLQGFLSPFEPPGNRRSQELFRPGLHSLREGPGGRRRGSATAPPGPRPAGAWLLSASRAGCPLSRFICTLQAPHSSLRSKLSGEEAMARSRGRLYLWMCLAAALASFLAGFMVGKCTNPFPERGETGLGCAGLAGRLARSQSGWRTPGVSARLETGWKAFGPS